MVCFVIFWFSHFTAHMLSPATAYSLRTTPPVSPHLPVSKIVFTITPPHHSPSPHPLNLNFTPHSLTNSFYTHAVAPSTVSQTSIQFFTLTSHWNSFYTHAVSPFSVSQTSISQINHKSHSSQDPPLVNRQKVFQFSIRHPRQGTPLNQFSKHPNQTYSTPFARYPPE